MNLIKPFFPKCWLIALLFFCSTIACSKKLADYGAVKFSFQPRKGYQYSNANASISRSMYDAAIGSGMSLSGTSPLSISQLPEGTYFWRYTINWDSTGTAPYDGGYFFQGTVVITKGVQEEITLEE